MRAFFGFEVEAPWPTKWPNGRVIEKKSRHITMAFMPEVDLEQLLGAMDRAPKVSFETGFCGALDGLIFLPPRHPRVVAYEPSMTKESLVSAFQRELSEWLFLEGFILEMDKRPWLPHMTIARKPFSIKGWKSLHDPLPFVSCHFHLYESMGKSHYEKRWSQSLIPPFEEIEHTADIAYRIIGENLEELYTHAKIALAFRDPHLLQYLPEKREINRLEDIIWHLNRMITLTDIKEGSAMKSVSYHGKVESLGTRLIWEMVVDV